MTDDELAVNPIPAEVGVHIKSYRLAPLEPKCTLFISLSTRVSFNSPLREMVN